MAKNRFWEKFGDLMDSIPDYIDNEIENIEKEIDNATYTKSTTIQKSTRGVSTSTIVQNGNKIMVTTVNGKTRITVDGVEYVPKDGK